VIEFDLNAHNRAALNARFDALDLTATVWHITARPKKSKRSLDQNDRYWKLITEFGNFCGYDKDEMHQEIGRRFLSYEKTINGKIKQFVKSTTKLNTAEMADLQDKIERVASQQGFVFDE
jgi:hypothetical protein